MMVSTHQRSIAVSDIYFTFYFNSDVQFFYDFTLKLQANDKLTIVYIGSYSLRSYIFSIFQDTSFVLRAKQDKGQYHIKERLSKGNRKSWDNPRPTEK